MMKIFSSQLLFMSKVKSELPFPSPLPRQHPPRPSVPSARAAGTFDKLRRRGG